MPAALSPSSHLQTGGEPTWFAARQTVRTTPTSI
jgi:hypothetical protein